MSGSRSRRAVERSDARRVRSGLVAVLLVPLLSLGLVLGGPVGAASAAASAWAGVSMVFEGSASSVNPVRAVTCWFAVRLASHGVAEIRNGECRGGPDVTPGFKQTGEWGTEWEIALGGVGCNSAGTSGTLAKGPDDAWNHTHSVIDYASWAVGTDCDPATVCMDLNDGSGGIRSECAAVNLDALPDNGPVQGCYSFDRMYAPHVESNTAYTGPGGRALWWSADVPSPTRLGTSGWFYFVLRDASGGLTQGEVSSAANLWDAAPSGWKSTHRKTHYIASNQWVGYAVVGIGFVGTNFRDGQGNNQVRSSTLDRGHYGINDPGTCRMYWGEKVQNLSGTDIDDPAGPLGPPDGSTGPVEQPAPTSPLPSPVDDAPVVDTEFGFWQAIIELLRLILGGFGDLLGAILDLPRLILEGLGDLLEFLFIPDSLPSFSDVPNPLPSSWLPDLPDLGGGACGPLTMPQLQTGFDGTTVGPVTFADTCSDPWPLVRTFVRTGLLVMASVSAAWMLYRAVASSLGMGVQTSGGGGGDDD